MSDVFYEVIKEIDSSGIRIAYLTMPGGYRPLHWHEELELYYPLNGDSEIRVEGKKYRLFKRQLMVVEGGRVHSTYCRDSLTMFICIHISKKHMRRYDADSNQYLIRCCPEEITDVQFPAYREICEMMEKLTRIYVEDVPFLQMETEGLILQILSHLFRFFSVKKDGTDVQEEHFGEERIREVITYVDEHFRESITLTDIASHVGLGNEYFCRFFRKHMGMSFSNYLGEVRLAHAFQELVQTEEPIARIMEDNGFTNQKHFNQSFKALYGCTPSEARRKK